MSQPPPYNRGYSFTDFSSGSPTSQPPGVKLDAEFDHIHDTLAATLTNLALIQRDDGQLKNASVGVDQLTTAVKLLLGADEALDAEVTLVATNIAAVALLAVDLAGANTIGNVAANSARIVTLAAISGNITTVAGMTANITSVLANAANINLVAGSIANVNLVAPALGAINTVNTDMALGAGASFILRAPQAAIDAAASAAAAAASAASVAIGAGFRYVGQGAPGRNLGTVGSFYYDQVSGLTYGPKTTGGWPLGLSLDANATRDRVELRYGAPFPTADWTVTRATTSTDLLYTDPYTYTPTTFAINAPVMRADGWGRWMEAKNFLLNSDAPVTQTTASIAIGKAQALAWGPAGTSIDVQPGTAVGSGWGTVAGDGLVNREITITTAGTVVVTVTGALTRFDLQQCPTLPSISKPVPHIPTTGAAVTRSADLCAATSAMMTWMNGGGRMLVIGTDKVYGSYSNSPGLLGLNGTIAAYAASATQMSIYDTANHNQLVTIGTATWQAPNRSGFAWDATATVTFGSGTKLEGSFPYQFNNAATVTSAQLGGASTSSYGPSSLCGLITHYDKYSTRPADVDVYENYTLLAPMVAAGFVKDFSAAADLRQFKRAFDRMQTGLIDCVLVPMFGDSHVQMVNPLANGVNFSLAAYMAERLNGQVVGGVTIAATIDTFAGDMASTFAGSGAASTANPRLKTSAVLSSGNGGISGTGPGGLWLRLQAGENIEFDPVLNTSKCTILYALDPAYGTLSFQVDDGAGGWTTVSTVTATGTANTMALASITGTLGARKWRMLGATGTCWVSCGWAYDPLTKPIIFLNAGRSGYRVATIASSTNGLSNALLAQRTLAAPLYYVSTGDTNDASDATTAATFETTANALLANMTPIGDVVTIIEPYSNISVITQALQDKYKRIARAVARNNRTPILDIASAQGGSFTPWSSAGFNSTDTQHLIARGQRRVAYAEVDFRLLPALQSL